MKNTIVLVSSLLAVFFFSLSSSYAQEKITTAGSSTIRPIVDKAAKAFRKTHPDVLFMVGGGGSTHGVKSVGTGEVLIGQASRFIKDKEMKAYPDIIPFKIGLDGVAIIINSDNPIHSITKQQVQDIYTGKISNWKEIGGNNAPIVLVTKEEGRSTLELFLKYFELEAKEVDSRGHKMMVHKKKGAANFSKVQARLIGPNKAAIASTVTKPNAIAYVSVGTAQEIAHKGAKIRLLSLDGVEATIANVANETYPLRRPLHVITKGEPKGNLREFIDFLFSDDGQAIVASLEFIPVK